MSIDIHSKYYIQKSASGYNPSIEGNNKYGLRPFNGSVLPNCIGYSVGRFNQRLKIGSCKYGGNYKYVEDFIKKCKSQGLKTGDTPKEGAIMCFGKGSAQHYANVEKVLSKTKVQTTESGWNYQKKPIVREVTRAKGSGNWGSEKKAFICFIYPPETGPKYKTYIVKKGDTLAKIARQFKTTVKQLAKDNDIVNVNLIKIGQKLKIREE